MRSSEATCIKHVYFFHIVSLRSLIIVAVMAENHPDFSHQLPAKRLQSTYLFMYDSCSICKVLHNSVEISKS